MGVSTLKYLSQIQFGGGSAIYELDDATPSAETEILTGMSAGYPEPLWIGIRGEKPKVTFSTMQIATMIGVLNAASNGAPWIADQSASNTDLWYADSSPQGMRTPQATAQHQRFRATKAAVYWKTISAKHQEDAKMDAELCLCYDGTNPPLQYLGSLALPGSPIGSERYTMGPVSINGTMLTGVQEVSLASGIKPNEEGSEGDIYTSFIGVDQLAAVLEVTGRSIEWWNTYGAATVITNVTWYLIKKSTTGNYANSATQHIAITGVGGLVIPESTSGRKSSTKLRIAFAPQSASYTSLSMTTGVII